MQSTECFSCKEQTNLPEDTLFCQNRNGIKVFAAFSQWLVTSNHYNSLQPNEGLPDLWMHAELLRFNKSANEPHHLQRPTLSPVTKHKRPSSTYLSCCRLIVQQAVYQSTTKSNKRTLECAAEVYQLWLGLHCAAIQRPADNKEYATEKPKCRSRTIISLQNGLLKHQMLKISPVRD